MATNVTQKYKTLKQVIDYCEKKMNDIGHDLDIINEHLDVSDTVYCQLQGQVDAYEDIALKCINLCREATDDAN
jgi:hypothetical protein